MPELDDSQTRLVTQIAQKAADEAVRKTLVSLGLDPASPLEMQKDMMAMREWREANEDEEFHEDLLYLRRWRLAMADVQRKGLITLVGIVVSGVVAAFWLGVITMLGR